MPAPLLTFEKNKGKFQVSKAADNTYIAFMPVSKAHSLVQEDPALSLEAGREEQSPSRRLTYPCISWLGVFVPVL